MPLVEHDNLIDGAQGSETLTDQSKRRLGRNTTE
jgi:hypothetical protein